MGILLVLIIVIAVLIIFVSILMAPDATTMAGALVGSADIDLFMVKKSRGMKKWLIRIMGILGISLLIVAIVIRVLI